MERQKKVCIILLWVAGCRMHASLFVLFRNTARRYSKNIDAPGNWQCPQCPQCPMPSNQNGSMRTLGAGGLICTTYVLTHTASSKCSQCIQAKAGTQQTYTFLEVHWALTFVLYTVPGTNARLVDQDCPTQSWNPTTSWKLFFNGILIDHC